MHHNQQGVAELFKLLPSNLHKLVSGKKYHRGSKGEGHKVSTLKELEKHGEQMVTVIKKKALTTTKMSISAATGSSKSGGKGGRTKSSTKVTVMKTMPKIIPLPFLDDETPASGTRGTYKKKKEGDD